MKKLLILSVLTLSLFPATAKENRQHEKHVHGEAELSLAVESNKTLMVEFKSPAESVVGFEHTAQTEKDKASVAAALKNLETNILKFLIFSPDAKCSVTKANVQLKHESEDEHGDSHADEHEKKEEKKPTHSKKHGKKHGHGKEEGEHSAVEAEFSIVCEAPLKGQKLQIEPKAVLPKLKQVEVKVIGETSQSGVDITQKGGSVSL